MNIAVQSWQDLQVTMPIDPRSVILNTMVGATQGSFVRSTSLLQPSWGTSPLAYTGILNSTKVISLDTTDALTIADAAQWTLVHQMVNVATGIPSSMNKVAFLRAGRSWDNLIDIAFGGTACNNVQLTMRDNQGTSGQFMNSATGSIPVFFFGSGITGNQQLHVTIAQPGIYSMALVMNISSVWSVFEMEWVVLP